MYAVVILLVEKRHCIVPIKWLNDFNVKNFEKLTRKTFLCFIHSNFAKDAKFEKNIYNKSCFFNTSGYVARVLVKQLFGKY